MEHMLRKHFEKIITLTNEEFSYILSHYSLKKLKKHQFLVQEGDLVLNDHFVLSGCLKAYYVNDEGKEHILQFGMPDWWISDYQALYNRTKATIHIDCIENSEVLCISLDNRERLCSELHKLEHFSRMKTNKGYVALQQRILSLLNNNAKERYDQLLQLQPELFQKLPKQLIASYLGVSRETLSRLHNAK